MTAPSTSMDQEEMTHKTGKSAQEQQQQNSMVMEIKEVEIVERQSEPREAGPTEVSPKEWQQHHELWLNTTMQATIGEVHHPPILELHAKVPV